MTERTRNNGRLTALDLDRSRSLMRFETPLSPLERGVITADPLYGGTRLLPSVRFPCRDFLINLIPDSWRASAPTTVKVSSWCVILFGGSAAERCKQPGVTRGQCAGITGESKIFYDHPTLRIKEIATEKENEIWFTIEDTCII